MVVVVAMAALKLNLLLGFLLLVATCLIGSNGALSESTMREVGRINKEGPFLGLVVPNIYEMLPLLQSPSFVQDTDLPYLDIGGRRFRFGRIEKQKVIIVMTGLSMLNAGLTTQLLLTLFKVKGVVHFGTAGNADPNLQIGDVTIPKYWAHTGLWSWQRYGDGPDDEIALEANGDYTRKIGFLEISDYNDATEKGGSSDNFLNRLWYQPEEVFPLNGVPEVRQHAFWISVDRKYYKLAEKFEGMKLERCINSSTCLLRSPLVVRVSRGCSANTFVSNMAYRQFLRSKFNVTTIDMESSAVAFVCLQQGIPFIAFRALSGGVSIKPNETAVFTSLATQNAVSITIRFISMLARV